MQSRGGRLLPYVEIHSVHLAQTLSGQQENADV